MRLDFEKAAPDFYRAVAHLDRVATKELDAADIDPKLRELIRIRASQLNGCAYCVDMHSMDARAIGETEQRIYALPVWPETPFFTDQERAALAFTENVTRSQVSDEAYAEFAKEFSEREQAAILSLVVTINAWNALGATTHAWLPGSYQLA
jgi:AhpD family alkylhydroperoxidase